MLADALDDTVVFELLDGSGADGLCERLRHRWHVGAYESEDVVLVVAELRPRQDDLAILLRAVKLWLLDNRLGALRFHLDGRAFVLESNPALLRGAAA
jgi:hypothetical protein